MLAFLCAAWLYAADTPQTLMDDGHHKRLRAIAEQRYREHPNDPEALWMMSFVKLSWDDHKMALELAEKAVAADPKNPRYHLALAEAVGREAQKAGILRQPGLALRFKRELAATLALDPKNVAAMEYLIAFDFAHTVLAVSLIAQDRWADLDAALAQAEKDVPDDLFPYFRAGQSCLARPNELARGERYFRKYLTQEPEPHSPNHSQAHWRLGQTLEKEGRKPAAMDEFQAAVKLDPDSPAKQDLKRLK